MPLLVRLDIDGGVRLPLLLLPWYPVEQGMI